MFNKQLLHPLLLNTEIYSTRGGNISRGRRPSTEGRINLVFNRGVGANNSSITYCFTLIKKEKGGKSWGKKKAGEKKEVGATAGNRTHALPSANPTP